VAVRPRLWWFRPGVLRALLSQVRLAVRLLREPRVPLPAKAIPPAAALYGVSPLDLFPDALLALGQLDDLAVLLVALELFIALCPPAAAAFHREAIASGRAYSRMSPVDDAIDAEWRRD
jgi:uncharacterized membrane protein YkvA (DUF1232 family)